MQSEESSEFFRGVVNTDVTMVKATPSDDNNNTVNTSSYPILVELTGRMAGQRMEQTDDDEQVHLSFKTFHLVFITNLKFGTAMMSVFSTFTIRDLKKISY